MSRYTVLGAAGFVGSRLVAALRASGNDVYAPARDDDGVFLRELGQVFYCIGLTADHAERPFDTVEAHVGLLTRILREARFSHLTYLSSTRLYDSLGERGGREDDALELNPGNPRHLYDLSKALGENLCLTVCAERTAVARLACVYDWAAGSPGYLSEWLQRAAREKVIRLDSGTGYVRDYIHLDDVVEGLRAMSDRMVNGIVNLASGENVSNSELAEVFSRCGSTIEFSREILRQEAPRCDIDRLAALWRAPRLVRDVVENYLSEH